MGKTLHYTSIAQHDFDGEASLPYRRRTARSRSLSVSCLCLIGILGAALFLSYRTEFLPIHQEIVSQAAGQKHLVIASTKKQDVTWLEEIPLDWHIKRYLMDVPNPNPRVGLSVPKNYGREAMAYLTYIIDHYDNLPDIAVFVHGHYRSWHQHAPISAKIRALNVTAVERENYVSLRCSDNMGCERRPYLDVTNSSTVNWWGENNMHAFWQTILPNVTIPHKISYKCCGQHAVTRRAMRHLTKDQWINVRAPLFRNETDMRANEKWGKNPEVSEWLLGAWYEKYWHLFFGQGPEYCPSLEHCRQTHFSNAIVCDGDEDTTPYEGDLWKNNKCVTAFDGVPAHHEPNWTDWNSKILMHSGQMRESRAKLIMEQRERLKVLEGEHVQLEHVKQRLEEEYRRRLEAQQQDQGWGQVGSGAHGNGHGRQHSHSTAHEHEVWDGEGEDASVEEELDAVIEDMEIVPADEEDEDVVDYREQPGQQSEYDNEEEAGWDTIGDAAVGAGL